MFTNLKKNGTIAVYSALVLSTSHAYAVNNNLGIMEKASQLQSQGNLVEAEKLYKQLLASNAGATLSMEQAVIMTELAGLLEIRGKNIEAAGYYQQAVNASEKINDRVPPNLKACMQADALSGWANALMNLGKFEEASLKVNEALTLTGNFLDIDSKIEMASALLTLSQIRLQQERWKECIDASQKSLNIIKAIGVFENSGELNLKAFTLLADASARNKQIDAALNYGQAALEIAKKHPGSNGQDLAGAYRAMSTVYFLNNQLADAKFCSSKALSLVQSGLGINHPAQLSDLNSLALIDEKQNNFSEAKKFFNQALLIIKINKGNDPHMVAMIENNLKKIGARK